ncbi:hypothetical protein [Nocardioides mesophilus]|uniref:Uncharacterized protein n=1 Tax=Nocardioides mesophilus TaxID=433659 RepID=A0A7G9R8D9_9ACTN|nr:hypothetical protein [Nocardioides mesophilus]QNN51864.1 hypothetical protein H9L09_15170 [Nocardioides mesophilus]
MIVALAEVFGFLLLLSLTVMGLDRMEPPQEPASPPVPLRRRHRGRHPARTGLHEGGTVPVRTCCRGEVPAPEPGRRPGVPVAAPGAPRVPAQRTAASTQVRL